MTPPLLRLVLCIAVCAIPIHATFNVAREERLALAQPSHQRQTARLIIDANVNASSGMQQQKVTLPTSSTPKPVTTTTSFVLSNKVREVKDRAIVTLKKAWGKRPSQVLKDDITLALDTFMPGKRPAFSPELFVGAFLGLVWLIVYLAFIYHNDREEPLDRWAHRKRFPLKQDPRIESVKPDVVLVFHHPTHEAHVDKHDGIDAKTLKGCLAAQYKTGYFRRVEHVLKRAEDGKQSMADLMGKGFESIRNVAGKASPRAEDAEAAEQEVERATMGHAREALLQDLYTALPKAGFEVLSFSSVDDDEIFVGISLERLDVTREELIRGNVKLQLRHSVVEHLKIGQDHNEMESSPPFIKYDNRMACNVLGEGSTDNQLYHTYHGKRHEGSIICGVQRIRLIQRHIQKHLNLDEAVKHNLIKDWYPVHSTDWLADLDACWARLDLFMDFTFVQPMTYIQKYFGSRFAFTFAWNGVYCKMLCALLPVALIFELAHIYDFWSRGSVTAFSLVLVVWAKLASNLYDREQQYFMLLWDLNGAPDFSIRPDFFGTPRPSAVDSTQIELHYPRRWAAFRQAVTWSITIGFCIAVAVCVYIWISIFQGRMNIYASICLACMIQVFQFTYNAIAETMTKMENHKYQNDFYGSYLMKLFIFQFVNQFSAYFFIAIKQKNTKYGCPDHDCIGLLSSQLSMTLTLLSIIRIAQVAASCVKVQIFMWWEDRQMAKEYEGTGKEVPVRGFLEEQAKYEDFRIRAQIEGMVQLVVALGYVLIFGAVTPRIIPLCFLVFVVQLRATAFMTTKSCRRPLPRKSAGLGAWLLIVQFLMGFGIVFSGYLLVAYGPSFEGAVLLTKVSGFIAYSACMLLAWRVATMCCSPHSSSAQLLMARRDYVHNKVAQANEEANIAHLKKTFAPDKKGDEPMHGLAGHADEVLNGKWDKIPHLIDDQQPEIRS